MPGPVPTGDAFRTKGSEDGVSVDVAAIHLGNGHDPSVMLDEVDAAERHMWGVLEVTVSEVEAEDLAAVLDEVEGNPAHALITPPPSRHKSRRLSKGARWALEPSPDY